MIKAVDVWGCIRSRGPHRLPTLSPSWSSVEGVMLTAHSWQSVSSPPTTMCHLRCGEQGLCWLQLKPCSGSRTYCLWSFFFPFKGLKCSRYCMLERRSSLRHSGGKKCKKWRPLVRDREWFKLEAGVEEEWTFRVFLIGLLTTICWAGVNWWIKCGVETSIRTSY